MGGGVIGGGRRNWHREGEGQEIWGGEARVGETGRVGGSSPAKNDL